MANVVITPTALNVPANVQLETRPAGETITAGQTLYLDLTLLTWFKATSTNVLKNVLRAVALNGGTVGQSITAQKTGTLNLGSGVTKDVIYVLSATSGGIAPSTDLAATWAIDVLGVGLDTGDIALGIFNSGVIHS